MFRSCVPGCADGAGSQGAGGGRQHSGGNTWPGRQRLSKLSGVLFVFIVGIAFIPLPGFPDYAISFELCVQNWSHILVNIWAAFKGDSGELVFLPRPESRVLCRSWGRMPGSLKSLDCAGCSNVAYFHLLHCLRIAHGGNNNFSRKLVI